MVHSVCVICVQVHNSMLATVYGRDVVLIAKVVYVSHKDPSSCCVTMLLICMLMVCIIHTTAKYTHSV